MSDYIRKAQPTARDSHVDQPLTNISIAYIQNTDHFVAHRVFSLVSVDKQSDRYYTFDRGDFNRDEAEKRAPGTESAGSGYAIDNTPTYFCDVWAWHKDVPDQVAANSDLAADPDRAATEFVTQKLLIRKEKDWAANYFAGGVWTNDEDGVAATPATGQTIHWSDTTSGDPIGDIRAAKTAVLELTGFMPNVLVVGQQVMDALEDHPDIVDRIKYSGHDANRPARVNERTLAQLFGLDEILVMRAIENTANRGATNAHSFIGGKKALLVHRALTPSLMTPTGGYTFTWNGYLNNQNEFGMAMTRIDDRKTKSERIEGEMAFDHKLVSADLGYFWDTIVA